MFGTLYRDESHYTKQLGPREKLEVPGKGGWVQEERCLMITSKSLRGTSKTMVMRCALMMFCLCSLNDVSKGQQVHDDMYLRGTQDPK